ncbi:hypothetical protein BDZ97DRAFT_427555 [Flammula alnicola]|nr:hypothetical protein BDZ97DRAFT_427555 [Flammula alnicola]
MEPTLISFMKDEQKKRLQRSHESVIAGRYQILRKEYNSLCSSPPFNTPMPGIAGIGDMDIFKALILGPTDEIKVTELDFLPSFQKLPELISLWTESAHETLLEILLQSKFQCCSGCDLATLQHATTIFKCSECNISLSYPEALVHSCVCPTSSSKRYRFGRHGLYVCISWISTLDFDLGTSCLLEAVSCSANRLIGMQRPSLKLLVSMTRFLLQR